MYEILQRWPHVLSSQEFVPSVGLISREKSDKLSEYFLEDDIYFLNAEKFLKFKELPSIDGCTYYSLYRRVKFSKSLGVVLLIAFRLKLADKKINISKIRHLINSILQLKVRFILRDSSEEQVLHLSKLSSAFKRNFYNYISKNPDQDLQFASANSPFITIFTNFRIHNKDFLFKHFTHEVGKSEFSVVLLSNNTAQYPYFLDRYRLYVYSKLFQSVSTAKGILRLILSRKISYPSPLVSNRLKTIYEIINKLNEYEPLSKEEITFINNLVEIASRGNDILQKRISNAKKDDILNNLMPKIKTSIKEGRIENILLLLENFVDEVDGEIQLHFLLFIFRIRSLNRNYDSGLISFEDMNVGINKIIYALLQFQEID